MPKPGVFRTYEGCFTVLLWALAIWGAFTLILLATWKWAT